MPLSSLYYLDVYATGATISCSLGRRYGPLFRLSLLDVYDSATQQARAYVTVRHFHPCLIFIGKGGAYPSGTTYMTQL